MIDKQKVWEEACFATFFATFIFLENKEKEKL